MPRIRSAKKRMRQSARQRVRNRSQRSAVRTAVKKVELAPSPDAAQAAFRTAERLLDRAARKGLIKLNTAARTKRRLARVVARKAEAA